MSEPSSNEGSQSNADDSRQIIDWQINRYQHVQSMSLGFLGISLTVLAVFATIYSALGSPLPSPKPPNGLAGPLFLGEVSSHFILGFGLLSSYLLGFLSIVMFILATWKFVSILMCRPIVETPLRNINYKKQVEENDGILNDLQQKLLFAGIRLPISILLFLLAIQVYLFTLKPDFLFLFFYSILLLVPKITPLLMSAVGVYPDKPVGDRPTLSQELLHEGPNSRINSIKLQKIERIPWLFHNTILIFILISFAFSAIWSFIMAY